MSYRHQTLLVIKDATIVPLLITVALYGDIMTLEKSCGLRLIKMSNKEARAKIQKSSSQKTTSGRNKTTVKEAKSVIPHPTTYKNHMVMVRSLTDKQLVALCVKEPGNDFYWEEFYKRFNRIIDKRIEKTLIELKLREPEHEKIEIKYDIYTQLMVKFHGKKILKQSEDFPVFVAWLRRVVRNTVFDWYDKYEQTVNVMDNGMDGGMVSLDDTINREDNEIRRIDTVADPKAKWLCDKSNEDISELLELVEKKVAVLDFDKRMAFFADLIFYRPLTDEEIGEIACKRKVSSQKIEIEIKAIMEQLYAKHKEYEHQIKLMLIRKDRIRRLERRLREATSRPDTKETDLIEINKEIQRETRLLQNLSNRVSSRPIGPSVADIVKLLGFTSEQKNNVSPWLKRTRDALIREREKRNKR